MSLRILIGLTVLAFGTSTPHETAAQSQAQATPAKPDAKGRAIHQSPAIYEDREIRVVLSAGWHIVPDSAIRGSEGPAMSLGNSVSQAEGKVLLEKGRYTLGLAFDTGHASGIEGGRWIEAFNIPWPGVEDIWDCSMYLSGYSQPASRIMTFDNVIVDSSDTRVREHCGIQKDLGFWRKVEGSREFVGSRRWFGGSFSTADRGLFFESKGAGCGLKAYTLTFQAKTPDQLPLERDPGLKKMIQEAIDIVNSIHYKRCAPAP